MRAILLSSGLGKRLRPLTDYVPKCMAPVNGRPLIQYWLDALFNAGIEEVLVNLHYRPELVRDFIATYPLRDRIQLVHEERLLGTGGTLLANRGFCRGEPAMLIHGDNLCGADLRAFIVAHATRTKPLPVTMMTFVTDRPQECGIVVADAAGVVREFHEKVLNPPGNIASAAAFILEPSVYLERTYDGDELDFSRDVLPEYVGRIGVFHNDRYHRDLGTVKAWLQAQSEWAGAMPVPFAGDAWCEFADRLASTAGAEIRAMLQVAALEFGCDGLLEMPAYDPVELNLRLHRKTARPPLYFFWSVQAGFSSRAFLETHRAPCLAMAACEPT